MEIPQILQQLERATGWFPRLAVETAIARHEAITPALLAILQNTVQNSELVASQPDYMAHLYAMLLLAQFREVPACPLVLQLAALPDDVLEELCGDFLGEDLPRVLASVCGGDTEGIRRLIADREADPSGRAAALDSLVILVASGQKSRDDVAAYFADLYRGGLEREPSLVWNALVSASADLCCEVLLEDIGQAYAVKLVDPDFVTYEEVKAAFAAGPDAARAALAENPHFTLIGDVVREMSGWACFHDRRSGAIKVGRNDPCPCGSGKKYKKCCLI
jgi:hypothetical protein